MNLFYLTLILIIIICLILLIYIYYYNKMQYLKTKIEHAESIIDEVLRSRYDYLIKADTIIKSTLKDNKEYFKEYINLKDKDVSNFVMDRKLKEAFHIVYQLRCDYPELQLNKELKDIMHTIKDTDEKITATTNFYNKNTNELNGLIRKFPSNIIAKIHKFKIKTYFDGKDMSDEDYNDFKL